MCLLALAGGKAGSSSITPENKEAFEKITELSSQLMSMVRRCKLDPNLKAPRFQRFNIIK